MPDLSAIMANTFCNPLVNTLQSPCLPRVKRVASLRHGLAAAADSPFLAKLAIRLPPRVALGWLWGGFGVALGWL